MTTAANKQLAVRYNKEVIEMGNMEVLKQITAPDYINHSAPEGMPTGIDGLIYFFTGIIHTAFTSVQVNVLDMVAEGNKVATRKEIVGVHTGSLMGIPATGKTISISVIDILTIENNLIVGHWGENNFMAVVQSLQA